MTTNSNTAPRLYKLAEVAEILGLTPWAVRVLVRDEAIEVINISSGKNRATYRVSEAALNRFLRARTKKATKKP